LLEHFGGQLREFFSNDLEGLDWLNIDYTSFTSEKDGRKQILKKCYKNYQDHNKLLLIVVYGEYDKRTINENKRLIRDLNRRIQSVDNIDHKQNIRVISFSEFKTLFGFKNFGLNNRFLDDTNKIQKFASLAVKSGEHLEKLINLWDDARRYLEFLKKSPMSRRFSLF